MREASHLVANAAEALTVSTPSTSSCEAAERQPQPVERLGDPGRELTAQHGELHLPCGAKEKRRADPLLEQLDLIAHRGLGHAQLLARRA